MIDSKSQRHCVDGRSHRNDQRGISSWLKKRWGSVYIAVRNQPVWRGRYGNGKRLSDLCQCLARRVLTWVVCSDCVGLNLPCLISTPPYFIAFRASMLSAGSAESRVSNAMERADLSPSSCVFYFSRSLADLCSPRLLVPSFNLGI
jgi:hypothetical protein